MIERNILKLSSVIAITILLSLFSGTLWSGGAENDKNTDPTLEMDKVFEMSLEELVALKVVTAGRVLEKISDIPASVVVITREEIEIFGYRKLVEVLEHVPGLYAIDDYHYGDNFGVRGFWTGINNRNMIILLNGAQVINHIDNRCSELLLSMPVEAVDRIEVVRGPMSVIYGSGAFYGALNIITRDPEKIGDLSFISTSIGSEKTRGVTLRVAGSGNHHDFALNASIKDTNGYDHPLSKMITDPSILPAMGLPMDKRTGGTLENLHKYLDFSGRHKNFSLDLNYVETKNEFYFLTPGFSEGSYDVLTHTNVTLGFHKKISEKFTLESKLNYVKSREFYKINIFFEDFYGMEQVESTAFSWELNGFIKASKKLEIKTGLFYRAITDVYDIYDLPSYGTAMVENSFVHLADDSDIVTRAFFTQFTYKPFPQLDLVAGFRLEQSPAYTMKAEYSNETELASKAEGTYDRSRIEFIPRLAAVYALSRRHAFKLMYGKAINRPSFFQNSQNTLPGLPDLEPERIETVELNYIASIARFMTINVSVFHNILNNLISRVVNFDENGNYVSFSANAGEMITNGLEMTVYLEPFPHMRLEASGIFQKTKDKRDQFKNIEVAYSPGFLGYLKASYRKGNVTAALTGNYVDGMETYWDETIPPNGDRIGLKTEPYFLLGANLRVENFPLEDLYFNIRCSNLLNKTFHYPTFTNNPWADRGTLGHSRFWQLTVGYRF